MREGYIIRQGERAVANFPRPPGKGPGAHEGGKKKKRIEVLPIKMGKKRKGGFRYPSPLKKKKKGFKCLPILFDRMLVPKNEKKKRWATPLHEYGQREKGK